MTSNEVEEGNGQSRQPVAGTMSCAAGMSVIAGCMIGAGIFVNGGVVYNHVPIPLAAIGLWVFAGIVAIFGGLCWAELALMIPQNGGDVPYLEAAFPRPKKFFAFMYLWTRCFFSNPMCAGLMSYICSLFFMKLVGMDYNVVLNFNMAQPITSLIRDTMLVHFAISIVFLLAAFLAMAFSDKIVVNSGTILTITKMGTLASLILMGFGMFVNPPPADAAWKNPVAKTANDPTVINFQSFCKALLTVLFAYDGFSNLSTVVGDLRNPKRDTLRAILIGCVSVTVLYVLLNALYLAPLTSEQAKKFEISTLYVSSLVGAKLSDAFAKLYSSLIVVSASGALLGISFAASRVLASSGSLGDYLPFSELLSRRHSRFGTPFNAIVCHFVVSFVYLLLMYLPRMFGIGFPSAMFGNWTFYVITTLGLIVLRRREPNRARPFKVYIVIPIFLVIVGTIVVIMSFVSDYLTGLVPSCVMAVGLLAYYMKIVRGGAKRQQEKSLS